MAKTENVKAIRDTETEALFQEVVMALEAEDWNRAILLSDEILENDPNNVKGYLYKLLANNKCKSNEELKGIDKPFDDDPLYQKILELGSIELKDELEAAILFIKAQMAEKAEKKVGSGVVAGFFASLTGRKMFKVNNGVLFKNEKYKGKLPDELIIPKEYYGEKVTAIGENAFQYCDGLTSITIPKSVTSIGDGAFSGCTSLNAVHISSLESWLSIRFDSLDANPLFCAKNLYLNGDLVTEVTVPDTITSINDCVFCECESITSITIPDSVTRIRYSAFSGCTGLTSITIPNGLTSIGDSAFYGCTGLTSIEIPNSVTSIGERAFSYCEGLTSIEIPNSVTSIGVSAFSDCTGLESVIFEDTSTWYYSPHSDHSISTQIDVTDATANAKYFTDTYKTNYWYKE